MAKTWISISVTAILTGAMLFAAVSHVQATNDGASVEQAVSWR